jgi:hypothetical protein
MTPSELPLLPLVMADGPPLLRRMLRQEGVPTVEHRVAPIDGRFVLFDSRLRPCPSLADKQTPIDVDEIRRRLGFDPWADHDAGKTCRSFWQVGSYEASEETAATDYGAHRRIAMRQLRQLLEQSGGLWARIAPFPAGYRSAFCFRFDHDDYVADDFNAVLAAIAGHEYATTHFVCGSTHGEHLGALGRLDGLDVGSHGFYHHTYRSDAENRRNIARGIAALGDAGLEPSGFAAPHGRSPAGLSNVLAELGVTHSSEFAAAYDDLPFRTATGSPWQIPIHPVCLGIVLESLVPTAAADPRTRQAAADAVAEYFVAVAEAKRAAGELTVLYGHPDRRLGRYPHILRTLLAHVSGQSDVWRTNLTSLAWWFDLRDRGRWTVTEAEEGWIVESSTNSDEAALGEAFALELGVGAGTAIVRLDGGPQIIRRSMLRPAATDRSGNLPQPIRREFLSGFKPLLRRWLDWERTTPIAEIAADHWRGRLKRTLRRVTA